MEEESEEEAGSPFWLSESRRNRSASDILLSTRLHLAILLVIAMLFMAIVTPTLVSQTRRLFRPTSFKRRWDFLNLLLVVFAVFCGFIGQDDGEDESENEDLVRSSQNMRSGQRRSDWYNSGDQGDVVMFRSVKRVNSSYPDLTRQEMSSVSAAPPSLSSPPPPTASIGGRKASRREFERGGRRVRRDDQVETRFPTPPPQPPPTTSMEKVKLSREEYESAVRIVRRYDQERRQEEIRPAPPPQPPPTTSMGERTFSRQEYERGGRRVRRDDQKRKQVETRSPQPPPLAAGSSDRKERVERDYRGRRRDKIEILETIFQPPPPPPPLPPPSFFDDISSSSQKPKSSKKYKTVPPPPPPPPPKPWPAMQIGKESDSPLIPPPPPPPPFKVPPWKFRVRGDYVKINSSPESSSESTIHTAAGNTSSESSWSSPVVSTNTYPTVPPPPPKPAMQIRNRIESPLIPPPRQPPPLKVPPLKFPVGGDSVKITSGNEGTSYKAAGNTSSESFWSNAVRDYVKIASSPDSSSEGTTFTAAGNTSSESFWSNAVRDNVKSPDSSSEGTTFTAAENTSSETFWSNAVRDYVKSPDSSSEGTTFTAAGNTSSESFLSSPDVNRKAGNFIARFKAKLELEKNNSLKRRMEGTSFSSLASDSSLDLI